MTAPPGERKKPDLAVFLLIVAFPLLLGGTVVGFVLVSWRHARIERAERGAAAAAAPEPERPGGLRVR